MPHIPQSKGASWDPPEKLRSTACSSRPLKPDAGCMTGTEHNAAVRAHFQRTAPLHPAQKSTQHCCTASSRGGSRQRVPLQPATGDKQPGVSRAGFLPGTGLEGRVGRELAVQVRKGGGRGLRLALLSVYTCRAEHQSLEDVRQGDDALDA